MWSHGNWVRTYWFTLSWISQIHTSHKQQEHSGRSLTPLLIQTSKAKCRALAGLESSLGERLWLKGLGKVAQASVPSEGHQSWCTFSLALIKDRKEVALSQLWSGVTAQPRHCSEGVQADFRKLPVLVKRAFSSLLMPSLYIFPEPDVHKATKQNVPLSVKLRDYWAHQFLCCGPLWSIYGLIGRIHK